MDWQTILQDAGIIASVSTAIFLVIDFTKRMFYKLPWGWVQKTPGEVWFALSILFGLTVAILVYWDNFFAPDATLTSSLSATTYGLVSGAGSKLINAVSSTAGVKLKASKEESNARIEAVTNGKKPDTVLGGTVTAPVISEVATPTVEQRIEDTKKKLEDKTKPEQVELVKKTSSDADYVIIDGDVHKITKEVSNGK